jgi:hypothetical protein
LLVGTGRHPFLEIERSPLAPNDESASRIIAIVGWSFEDFASSPQVTMPGLGFALRQVHPGQSLGKIAAYTNLLAVWHETGEWFAVF